MPDRTPPPPCIHVLAGTNGAGKSSVAGAAYREAGGVYFNPDERTRVLRARGFTPAEANARAWKAGVALLRRAIRSRDSFAFETTLGGSTITELIEIASLEGLEVSIWYVGLTSPELHVARVRARVQRGGHDIPEARIRERYERSRANLVMLILRRRITDLRVFDNSRDADPGAGLAPEPLSVMKMHAGRIVEICPPEALPAWAEPIVTAARAIDPDQWA